jgi:hypothetical protein
MNSTLVFKDNNKKLKHTKIQNKILQRSGLCKGGIFTCSWGIFIYRESIKRCGIIEKRV